VAKYSLSGSAAPDGSRAAPSLVHATQPLSPMSGREFDPLSANQKPPPAPQAAADDMAQQQKVLSSFGVAATAAAAVDGQCFVL